MVGYDAHSGDSRRPCASTDVSGEVVMRGSGDPRGCHASSSAASSIPLPGSCRVPVQETQLLYAHSANDRGERQLLVDHLRNVARLARDLASPFDGGGFAFLAATSLVSLAIWQAHSTAVASPSSLGSGTTWGRLIHCGSVAWPSVKRGSASVSALITSALERSSRRRQASRWLGSLSMHITAGSGTGTRTSCPGWRKLASSPARRRRSKR